MIEISEPAVPGEAAAPAPRHPRRRIWKQARALGLQLLLVFVGVWAALAAESWRDHVREQRQIDSLLHAIHADISDLTHWYGGWRDSVSAGLGDWENDQQAGRHTLPYYVRMPGSEHGAMVGWQVALASGALDALDPNLVFEIGRVSREFEGVGERFARYMAQTEALVLPNVARGAEWFYDSTGELKPEYAANIALLEELLHEMDEKVAWLERLDAKLAGPAGK